MNDPHRQGESVLDSPGGLSKRAQEFLASEATVVKFDQGLVGDDLRAEMMAVHGRVDEQLLATLDRVQRRYGGLTYQSGYFDAYVTFTPACEPEPNAELEILYAVQTGSSAGASVKRDGRVEVGFDYLGVTEFASLDFVIESDSMYHLVTQMAFRDRIYLDGPLDAESIRRRLEVAAPGIAIVAEASGAHSYWYQGNGVKVGVQGVWFALGFGMPPLVTAGCLDEDQLRRVRDSLS